MRHDDEIRRRAGQCDGEIGRREYGMIGCFESFGHRFRDPGEVRDHRPVAVGRAALEKRGQVVAEPAQLVCRDGTVSI